MSVVVREEAWPALERESLSKDVAAAEAGAPVRPRNHSEGALRERELSDPDVPDDHEMRLPYFHESCPHVRDQIIPMNGGHFNVDHYLRVLRARVELDVSIAMSMTALGQQKAAAAPALRSFHVYPP